jgi:hypothetical protein
MYSDWNKGMTFRIKSPIKVGAMKNQPHTAVFLLRCAGVTVRTVVSLGIITSDFI